MTEMRERRRVALVASSYHPHFGGVEEHTRHVARVLRSRGHAVEVWTVDRGEHLKHAIVDGIDVRYLPTPLPARRVKNALRFGVAAPVALGRWFRAAWQFKPDLIHVHCFGPNGPYATALAAVVRIPVVLSGHGETFMDAQDIFGKSALMRHQLRSALQSSEAVTACSAVVADDLVTRFGAGAVKVVPNGVTAGAPKRPGHLGGSPAGRRVIAVGRMVPIKGFDLLLRAFSEVEGRHRLLLVGDGPERPQLEDLAEDLGIRDRVDFLGRVDGTEVQGLMSAADLVVVPSRREAFGIVVLEAWASGTPLIATALGGPRDIVTDGVDGLVVNPENPVALASAIKRVLSDPKLGAQMAIAGRRSVQSYTWDSVVNQYEEIYDAVLTQR